MSTAATLAAAAEHAREARHDTARRLLEPLTGVDGADLDALDLLARVHAQQGDLVAADVAWQRVLDLDPTHRSALAGQARIRELWSGPRSGLDPRVGAGIAAAALLVAGAGAFWLGGLGDASQDDAYASEVSSLREETSSIAGDVDQLRNAVERSQRETERFRKALADPRWDARVRNGSVTVTFAEPVFESGSDQLSPDGRATLRDLAPHLIDARSDGAALTVVGHAGPPAEPAPDSTNHSATLGLARALAAASVLTDAGLPRGTVTAVTGGDLQAPFPADDDRNQTVTLDIELGSPITTGVDEE